MKTIVKANSIVSSVVGEQPVKDADYRLMKYTFQVETEDGMLLHNVITGQLVLLTEKEKRALDRLPMRVDEGLTDLISGYYLVPAGFDEYSFVQGYRRVLQMSEKNKKKAITKYTIFPTTCCNAHCFYCFESEYRKITMDSETARRTADFIIHNAEGQKVTIGWFGGEPTVAMQRIDEISAILKESGIEYSSSMVSNGYLFSEDVVKKAVEDWKLTHIQITLDGTEEIYNKTKDYRVQGSAYRRVLQNIKLLLEAGIGVTVLLNLDEHNEQDLFELVNILAKQLQKYKRFNVSSHILFEDEGYEKVHHTQEQEEKLARRNYELVEYMKEVGLNGIALGNSISKGVLPSLRYLYCMVNDSASLIIGPNGSFYKCEHIPDDLHSRAGLDRGLPDDEEFEKWFVPREEPQCKNCCLYPECFYPRDCKDHRKCLHIDAEMKIAGFKETAEVKYIESKKQESSKN